MSKTQETLVDAQFGPQAAAYISSAVHAQGDDLAQITAIAKARRPARVLDLGCGGGHVAFNVAPFAGEVVAYDLSAEMLAAVKGEAAKRGLTNLATRQGAVEALPFAAGEFDMVLSRYSAHHWHDFQAGITEARRVVTDQGYAAFGDAMSPGVPLLDSHLQTIEILRDPSHVRDYSEAEWRTVLATAGFAPGAIVTRKLPLDFTSWVERMRTPAPHIAAIHSLLARVPEDVQAHFQFAADGSFLLDTMVIEATPA